MKKALVLITVVALMFCFFSCKTSEETVIVEEEVVVAETPAVAAPAALEVFPAGKWLDANWDALWVIYDDQSVKLFDSVSGDLIYDFKDGAKDIKIEKEGLGLKLSFRCDDTQRFYAFTKDVEGTDLELDIDRDWTDEPYVIVMPLQQ